MPTVDAGVVVAEADDIIFAQVLAVLHLNNHQRDDARVLQAMLGARGHVGGLVGRNELFFVSAGDLGGAGNDNPVFASMVVLLQAKAMLGQNHDPLDFVARALFQHCKAAPRPTFSIALDQLVEGFGREGRRWFFQ